MSDFFRTAFKNPAAVIASVLFVGFLAWWAVLHLRTGTTSEQFQLWGATYQLLAWFGAITGFVISRRWGGMRSYVGKAIIAFSLGLLFQSFGQTTYSWYVYALNIPIPYPSIGDIGFFGSIPCYFYGAFMLAKVSGARISLRASTGQVLAVVIPLILLLLSYIFFLRDYTLDLSQPLKTFLDFGYPLGQALYVSMAITAFVLTWRVLGGVMRAPMVFFIIALIVQYFSDFNFLYEASQGTFYSGGTNDLMYTTSYFLMAMALIYIGQIFVKIRET